MDELIEEGNAFEADVVAGVEDAGDADEKEVHTHEVPEDDVPLPSVRKTPTTFEEDARPRRCKIRMD